MRDARPLRRRRRNRRGHAGDWRRPPARRTARRLGTPPRHHRVLIRTVHPPADGRPDTRMKIAYICNYYKPAWGFGGGVTSAVAMCESLAALGADVRVLTTDIDVDGYLRVPIDTPQ